MELIFEMIGRYVAYGGGAVTLSYLTFQWLGKKWIEKKFSQQLANIQYEHNKALAHLKVEVDSSLSGSLKMQEQEFSALPQLWSLLLQSYSGTRAYTYPLEVVPDVSRMTSPELDELINGFDWLESDKRAVREASRDRRDYVFSHIRHAYKVDLVRKDWFKAANYIKEQSIFLPTDLVEAVEQIQGKLWGVISDKEVGVEIRDIKLQQKAHEDFEREVDPLLKSVSDLVRLRLRSHMKTPGGTSVQA